MNIDDFVSDVKNTFEVISSEEGTNVTFDEWIEKTIKEGNEIGILNGLTDKEKFLYALGLLNGMMSERYMEDYE